MRAIDADELKIGISGRPWEWNRVEICKFIDKQSTIEPQRKKGKWIKDNGDWFETMFRCSECGALIRTQDKLRSFFCYHCGARMEGEG